MEFSHTSCIKPMEILTMAGNDPEKMVQRVLNQKKHRALQGWLEFTAETDLIHARWKSKSNYELQLLRDKSICHWLDLQTVGSGLRKQERCLWMIDQSDAKLV